MDYYFDNTLPINIILENKFKKTLNLSKKNTTKEIIKKEKYPYHKQFRKYQLTRLALFINKIFNYEPELVRLIGFIHDKNYESIVPLPLNDRRPLRRNACIGLMDEFTFGRDYYCVCNSCDPYGCYMLKPYRIGDKLSIKLKKHFYS